MPSSEPTIHAIKHTNIALERIDTHPLPLAMPTTIVAAKQISAKLVAMTRAGIASTPLLAELTESRKGNCVSILADASKFTDFTKKMEAMNADVEKKFQTFDLMLNVIKDQYSKCFG